MYSFGGLIRWTPPPTFSDIAITDRHSDTTIFQLRAHWVRISWSTGSEKSFGHVPPVGFEPSTPCENGEHPIHLRQIRLSKTYTLFYFCAHDSVYHRKPCYHVNITQILRDKQPKSEIQINSKIISLRLPHVESMQNRLIRIVLPVKRVDQLFYYTASMYLEEK